MGDESLDAGAQVADCNHQQDYKGYFDAFMATCTSFLQVSNGLRGP